MYLEQRQTDRQTDRQTEPLFRQTLLFIFSREIHYGKF